MHCKILNLTLLSFVCSVATAYTMVNISSTNSSNNITDINSVNITNKNNNNPNSINTLPNNNLRDTIKHSNNEINTVNNILNNNIEAVNSIGNKLNNNTMKNSNTRDISENSVTISQVEKDKFLENYNKYPELSSLNACLQFSSLIENVNPAEKDIVDNIDLFFDKDDIFLNKFIDTNIDFYNKDNDNLLMQTMMYSVIDNYINNFKVLTTDTSIKDLIKKTFDLIKDRIQNAIDLPKNSIFTCKKYLTSIYSAQKEIQEIYKILDTSNYNLVDIKNKISNTLEVIYKLLDKKTNYRIRNNLKTIHMILQNEFNKSKIIKNLDQIQNTIKLRINQINNTIQQNKNDLNNNNSNNKYRSSMEYIFNLCNDTKNTNNLVNQIKSKIKEYDLYNVINKTIKGVNYITDLQNGKISETKYMQTIYTLSNNNNKCGLMSTWELIRTILAHECMKNKGKLPDELKNSNFARFDNYLCNQASSNDRKIIYEKSTLQKINEKYLKETDYYKGYAHFKKYHDLTVDRTGKSNVNDYRIDLLSELILWDANNKWVDDASITNNEKTQRKETIELLKKLQDINYTNHGDAYEILIILNIFPELKKYIGNKVDIEDNNTDVIQGHANEFIDKLNKYKSNSESFLNNTNTFFINNNEHANTRFNRYESYKISNAAIISIDDYKYKFNNTSPYLILSVNCAEINELVHGYKFISSYDDNGKLNVYELIGTTLSNGVHAVTFAKKGSADNSWCGIDSNRNANDNNYKLDDILYNKEPWYNNTYLAKVYADEEGNIYNKSPYRSIALLYKKIL